MSETKNKLSTSNTLDPKTYFRFSENTLEPVIGFTKITGEEFESEK